MLIKDISKNEWWFVGLITAIIIIFTSIPFVFGYIYTPKGGYFTGIHSLAPGDYHVYFSNILETYKGHFLYRDLYTTESTQYNIINIFWNFAGLIGKIFSFSPILAFHASRIIAIPILLFTLYIFASYLYGESKKRKFFFLFLCFASGVGAYFEPLFANVDMAGGYYGKPMDVWVAESNIFLSMLHSGHMTLSLALVVIIFLLYLVGQEKQKFIYSIIAGASSLLLLSFHPFLFPIICAVLFSHIIFLFITKNKQSIRAFYQSVTVLLMCVPMLLYYAYMMTNDIVSRVRAEQNINVTPLPHLLVLSYGFLFIFGVCGIYQFLKQKDKDYKTIFLFIWLAVQIVIIYLPFNFQRRMVEGLSIPLIFFAFEYLWYLYPRIENNIKSAFIKKYIFKNPIAIIYILAMLFGASNLFVWARDIALSIEANPSVYISQKEVLPMLWFKNQADNNIKILADVNTAHFIPGIGAKTVFAGHAVETLYFSDKEKRVQKFFQDNISDNEKIEFLRNYGITHIYYGPREKMLGKYNPEEKKYLSKAYDGGEVSVYKVIY